VVRDEIRAGTMRAGTMRAVTMRAVKIRAGRIRTWRIRAKKMRARQIMAGGGATAAAPTHYFVDVPNPEESTYKLTQL
jgi:hypothetical protein